MVNHVNSGSILSGEHLENMNQMLFSISFQWIFTDNNEFWADPPSHCGSAAKERVGMVFKIGAWAG